MENKIEELNNRANVTFSAKEKLKFNDTIIEITDNKELKINDLTDDKQNEISSQTNYDGEITESEYQNRENDDLEFLNEYEETLKKSVYRQATMINQSSIISPKFQRIHEGVSRVFGLDDPPPGFGLIYPKYYYLEQKRPQPMSPLKVWRGFNGNIYFEPIHLQNFNLISNEASQSLNFNRQNSQKNFQDNEQNQTTQSVSKFIDLLDYTNDNNNNNNKTNDSNLKFHNNNNRFNTAILLEEASELLLANTLNKKTQTFFQVSDNVASEIMSTTSLNALRKSNKINQLALKRHEIQREHSKLRISTENQNKILPNLAAVKRNNVPLRGLAFKEVKQRIHTAESSNENFNLEQNNKQQTLDPNGINYGEHYNKKATPEELFRYTNTTGNSGYLRSNSPPKLNYRDMRKGIRKGVTMSTFYNNNNNNNAFNEHQRLLIEDEKKHSLNEIFTPKLFGGLEKKSKTLITHRNFKILNIKGDRISNISNIDILVPKSAAITAANTNTDLASPNTSNSHYTNVLTEKSKTDITPNKINKIVIKTKIKSPSSLSMKSNLSLVSIQPNNNNNNNSNTPKRLQNTSPEIT